MPSTTGSARATSCAAAPSPSTARPDVAELIDRDGRLRIAVGHGDSVTVESGEVTYER